MAVVASGRRVVGAGWVAAGACVLVAALSLLAPHALIYDAWSWSLWARELADGTLDTTGLSGWKPLPPLVGAPVALLGGSPAAAWLIVERAAALGAAVLAWALAARRGGWPAGLLAVILLVLLAGWPRYAAEGYSEPVVVALLLGAVLAALDERHGWTLLALTGAALLRPEAWPLLAVAGAWAWRARPDLRWAVAAAGALVAVLWIGGEWIGSGDPLAGSDRARASRQPPGSPLGVAVPFAPAWAGVAVTAVAGWRSRDRELLLPVGVAAAWTLTVAAMDLLGYPGLDRFQVPAAALWSVAGAVGLVALVRAARARGPAAAAAAVAALAAVAVWFGVGRLDRVAGDVQAVADRVAAQRDLRRAVAAVGAERLAAGAPCVNLAFHSALAALLGVHPSAVCAPAAPAPERCSAFVLRTGRDRVTGLAPEAPAGAREIARAGRWTVLALDPPACQAV